jgi:putative ABC transport system permease protein
MDSFLQDLRYGCRMLLTKPGFALTAVLSLALGIGANTAIFSAIHSVLLRPLPLPQPDRLQALWTELPKWGRETASLPDYTDWRQQSQSFEDMAAMTTTNANLGGVDDPERLVIGRATASFFRVLQASPVIGRAFSDEEDAPNRPKVAMLSYGLWQRRFGGRSDIVGQTVSINAVPYTVIGVAPRELGFAPADVWAPLAIQAQAAGRRADFLQVFGRLKPGVTPQQAQAELTTIARRLEQQYPGSNLGVGVGMAPLHDDLVREVRPMLLSLWAAVGFVLLIVVANVSNLLLARGAVRQKELAIRKALGAGGRRLMQQLLTESVLLAVIGGGLGMALAVWGVRALTTVIPQDVSLITMKLEMPVLLFATAVTLGSGLLFGLLPALIAAQTGLNDVLKEGGRGSSLGGRQSVRRILVGGQIAVSLVLLVGAGLMIRTLYRLQQVDPGFRAGGLLTFRVTLPPAVYKDQKVNDFLQQLLPRLQSLPQVKSAAALSGMYLGGGGNYLSFEVQGLHEEAPGNTIDAEVRAVTPGVLRTLGIPLVRGRMFADSDNASAPRVAVINERLARRYFSGQDLIGKRVSFSNTDGKPDWREVIGVIGDVRQQSVATEAYPEIMVPVAQRPSSSVTVVVDSGGPLSPLAEAARREVSALDASLPIYTVRTGRDLVASSMAQPSLQTYLLGAFGALALGLAVVGIYGVMAHVVTQRTAEFGIRMALGARPVQILGLVLGTSLRMAGVGLAVGLAASLALTRFLARFLYGVGARDPWTLTAVVLVLGAAALLASYIPARRAMRVDPMVALRYE